MTAEGAASLTVRRVRCVDCGRTHSLIPAFAASGAHADDGLIEHTGTSYLADPAATYRSVAAAAGIAHATAHRWLTRLGRVAVAGLFAAVLALRPSLDLVATLPKLVAGEERKARSPERTELLRSAQQALVAGRLLAEERCRGLDEPRPPTIATLFRHPT